MVMLHRERGLPALQTSIGGDCREVNAVCSKFTLNTYIHTAWEAWRTSDVKPDDAYDNQ
jgi:hypothetical protein